jgi:hypothetical protein
MESLQEEKRAPAEMLARQAGGVEIEIQAAEDVGAAQTAPAPEGDTLGAETPTTETDDAPGAGFGAADGTEQPNPVAGTAAPGAPHIESKESSWGQVGPDQAGPEQDDATSQAPAILSNPTPNNPTLTDEEQDDDELDDGGCFEPYIPPPEPEDVEPPAPTKRKREWYEDFRDDAYRQAGLPCPSTVTSSETGLPAPAADETDGDAEDEQPVEIVAAPVEEPLPPPRMATAAELLTWIQRCLVAETHLTEDAATLVAFWVISTWFQEALAVLPCLVLTGPAPDAIDVLLVLRNVCREAMLVSGFQRSHLGGLNKSWTNLISEPNLNKRTAALLGDLTYRNFFAVAGDFPIRRFRATAIYAGDIPGKYQILNALRVHLPPSNAARPAPPAWLQKMKNRLPIHLDQYRTRNLDHVFHWEYAFEDLSSQTTALANALGRCMVGGSWPLKRLLKLLRAQDHQRVSEMSDSTEAIVFEAARALSRDGRDLAYSGEIAAEANRLLKARGETVRLSAEKAGHRLKTLGLGTRPLSQKGHGLKFDKATVAAIQQLATVYGMEDFPA